MLRVSSANSSFDLPAATDETSKQHCQLAHAACSNKHEIGSPSLWTVWNGDKPFARKRSNSSSDIFFLSLVCLEPGTLLSIGLPCFSDTSRIRNNLVYKEYASVPSRAWCNCSFQLSKAAKQETFRIEESVVQHGEQQGERGEQHGEHGEHMKNINNMVNMVKDRT